jgi:hypothetical protein
MGIAPVVVRLLLSQAVIFTSFTEFFRSPDRMVTFSAALLLFSFVISNLWTQLFVALTSFPLLAVTLWCLWMGCDSSSDGGIVPARLKRILFNLVGSLRISPAFPVHPPSLASDDGSSRHLPGSSQGDVRSV